MKTIRDRLITLNITGIGTNIKVGFLEETLMSASQVPCVVVTAESQNVDQSTLGDLQPSDRMANINVYYLDAKLPDGGTAVEGDAYLKFIDNVDLIINAINTDTTILNSFDLEDNLNVNYLSNEDGDIWIGVISLTVKKKS